MAAASRPISCSYAESRTGEKEEIPIGQMEFKEGVYEKLRFILFGKGKPAAPDVYKDKKGRWRHKPGCGEYQPACMCENPACRKPHYLIHRCLRRLCPDCYKIWISDAVLKISARLLSTDARIRHGGRQLAHMIVSPPRDRIPQNRKELNQMIHDAYAYARSKGVLGGSMFFHPYRASDAAIKEAVKANMKVWAWIRQQPDWRSWCYFSPHFHLTVYIGQLKPPVKGEGWVYKTITRNGKIVDFSRKAKSRELEGLIGYLLSHAATLEEKESSFHAVHWFGTCSYNKFGLTEEEKLSLVKDEITERYCKVCGAPLIAFWVGVSAYLADVACGAPEPQFSAEIDNLINGEKPPPDAGKFRVDTLQKDGG
jgi:hypothetical protein